MIIRPCFRSFLIRFSLDLANELLDFRKASSKCPVLVLDAGEFICESDIHFIEVFNTSC